LLIDLTTTAVVVVVLVGVCFAIFITHHCNSCVKAKLFNLLLVNLSFRRNTSLAYVERHSETMRDLYYK
jgi:hypothetical protein